MASTGSQGWVTWRSRHLWSVSLVMWTRTIDRWQLARLPKGWVSCGGHTYADGAVTPEAECSGPACTARAA
jgi:hypothetical protein